MSAVATQSLQAALEEHLSALCARDAERFAATLGDDVTVIDGRGTITRGTERVVRSHADWFASPNAWRQIVSAFW